MCSYIAIFRKGIVSDLCQCCGIGQALIGAQARKRVDRVGRIADQGNALTDIGTGVTAC
jgi:hypothetical protein